jgi:primosomal protein N' (replication factor Y)
MPKYIEVAVNVPRVMGVFHYHLPNELEENVKEGSLLIVPFGKRVVYGVGLRFIDEPMVEETKAVIDLLDPKVALTRKQIRLAYWLAENTLSPLAACISLMVPAGLMQMADNLYEIIVKDDPPDLKPMQRRLYQLLKNRGPLRGQQIKRSFPKLDWRPAAEQLVKKGVLKKTSILLSPKVKAKRIRTVQLIYPKEEVDAIMDSLGKQGTQALERRQKIMRFL